METLPRPGEPAAYPRGWQLLNRYGILDGDGGNDGDGRTAADSRTSTGWRFRVSFALAPPPASSSLIYSWPGGGPPVDDGRGSHQPTVVAAHGGCVLLQLRSPEKESRGRRYGYNSTIAFDYFLYEAAAGTPTPAPPPLPAMSLLPACYVPRQYMRREAARRRRMGLQLDAAQSPRMLHEKDTVLLRRAGGEVLVADLELRVSSNADAPEAPSDAGDGDEHDAEAEAPPGKPAAARINAELCVLWPGRGDGWEHMQEVPVVVHGGGDPAVTGDGSDGSLVKHMQQWQTDAAISVGDRFLCFADYLRGILICDTADMEESAGGVGALALRYVPLPVVPPDHVWHGDRGCPRRCRILSAAAGASSTIRFVTVDERCCCGGPGRTSCERGRFAFTVTTWTLSLTEAASAGGVVPSTWVKDGMVDCEEIWASPAYHQGVPHVYMEYPTVSCDDPDVVCFTVQDRSARGNSTEEEAWMVEINTRSKEVLRAIPSTIDVWKAQYHMAVKLQW